MKWAGRKSALTPPPHSAAPPPPPPRVVYSTDHSQAVVPVLVLLFVALWFILRGDLFYVLPYVILFMCFSVLLALRLPRLGKRELVLVLLYVCSIWACLVLSVSSSSWYLGRAAVYDCGTPWTFLLPPFFPFSSVDQHRKMGLVKRKGVFGVNTNSKDLDQPVEICSLIRNFATLVLQYPMILLADSEGPDQTARMRSLIWAFIVRISPKIRFRIVQPNFKFDFSTLGWTHRWWAITRGKNLPPAEAHSFV